MLSRGKNIYQIKAYRIAYITVDTLDRPRQVTLLKTALVPRYLTNYVALLRFAKKNVY